MSPKLLVGGGPVPIQPEMLDLRAFHQEIMGKGRLYFIQNGWVFDRHIRLSSYELAVSHAV